jgi:hypothetical protein
MGHRLLPRRRDAPYKTKEGEKGEKVATGDGKGGGKRERENRKDHGRESGMEGKMKEE